MQRPVVHQLIFIRTTAEQLKEEEAYVKVPCPYCGEEFSKSFKLGDHVGELHSESDTSGGKVYRCSRQHCNQYFKTLLDVVRHDKYVRELRRAQQEIAEQLKIDSQAQGDGEQSLEKRAPVAEPWKRQGIRYECKACRLVYAEGCDFFAHYEEIHNSDQGLVLSALPVDSKPGQVLLEIGLPPNSDDEVQISEETTLAVCDSTAAVNEFTNGYSVDPKYEDSNGLAVSHSPQTSTNNQPIVMSPHQYAYSYSPDSSFPNSSVGFGDTTSYQVPNYEQYIPKNMTAVSGNKPTVNADAMIYANATNNSFPQQFSKSPVNTIEMENIPNSHGYQNYVIQGMTDGDCGQSTGTNVYQPYEASNMTYQFNNVLVGGIYGNRIVRTVSWGNVNDEQLPMPQYGTVSPVFNGAVMNGFIQADTVGHSTQSAQPNTHVTPVVGGQFIYNGAFYDVNFYNALYNARQACENMCPEEGMPGLGQQFVQQQPRQGA